MDVSKLGTEAARWLENLHPKLLGEAALVISFGKSLPDSYKVEVERDYKFYSNSDAAAGYFNFDMSFQESTGAEHFIFEMKYGKKSKIDIANLSIQRVKDDIIKLAAVLRTNSRCFFVIGRPKGSRLSDEIEKVLDGKPIVPKLCSDMPPKDGYIYPSARLRPSADHLKDKIGSLPIVHLSDITEPAAFKFSSIISIYEVKKIIP